MIYTSMAEVPTHFRTVAPILGGKPIRLTLSQVNKLAEIYNGLYNGREGGQSKAIEKAKEEFRKGHLVKGGKWIMAEDTNEELLPEIWVKVKGSYEDDQNAIRTALRGSKLFGAVKEDYDLGVEATFKDYIIVKNSSSNPAQYYKANWKKDSDNKVMFSEIKTIEPRLVLEALNEQERVIQALRDATGTISLNEVMTVPFKLTEKRAEDGTIKYIGSADVVQRGSVINNNDRRYRKQILREAVADAQMRMAKHGPLLMESKHRTKVGSDGKLKNDRELLETVAVIKDLNWHDDTETISLDEIEFLETDAGRNMVALINGGARPQLSQRANGAVELMKEESTNRVFQDVLSLRFDGWDFVPPGEAGVEGASLSSFEVISEGLGMAEQTVLTKEEVLELIKDSSEELKTEIKSMIEQGFTPEALTEALKASGLISEESDEDENAEEVESEPEDDKKKKKAEDDEGDEPAEEDDAFVTEMQADMQGIQDTVQGLTEQLTESQEQVALLVREREINSLQSVGAQVLTEALEDEKYSRFTDEQKEAMRKRIDLSTLHGSVDVADPQSVKDAVEPVLLECATMMDEFIAASHLKATGYPSRGTGSGIAHIEMVSEQTPNMEYMMKLKPLVEKNFRKKLPKEHFWMSDDHPNMAFLNEVLAKYDRMHWADLKKEESLLLEANEEVMQLDIGVKVKTLARVVIETAYRAVTALQICDVGTMTNRIEELLISSWVPAETTDIADDMASVEITEGSTIATAGVTYTNVPIYAIWRPLRTFISSNAKATARGTAMNPEADAVAGLSLDLQRRVDRYLWNLMIAEAQTRDAVEVSTFESMTQVGSTNEWVSLNEGYIRYEVLQTADANGNPTGQKLGKLYAGPTGNVLEPLAVQEEGGDNTDLVYTTDYTVNWADGSITLTASGVTKEAGNGLHAKYSYCTANCNFWNVVPPTALTGYDHLINLRQDIGKSKVLVSGRNYAPNFVAMSLEIEDMVTSGPQFTSAGATASDVLNRLNEVMTYAGLSPVKTSAIPSQWVIIGEEGACIYRVHTPWSMRGPITDKDTGHDYYLGEEYTGAIVPIDNKLSLVGITDLHL